MIYPATPGIWVCQHVVPPIADLVVFGSKDGCGTLRLHSPIRCRLWRNERRAMEGRAASSLRLLTKVIWINTVSRHSAWWSI